MGWEAEKDFKDSMGLKEKGRYLKCFSSSPLSQLLCPTCLSPFLQLPCFAQLAHGALVGWQGGTGPRELAEVCRRKSAFEVLIFKRNTNSGGNPVNQKHLPVMNKMQRFAAVDSPKPVLPFGCPSHAISCCSTNTCNRLALGEFCS